MYVNECSKQSETLDSFEQLLAVGGYRVETFRNV